MSSDPQRQTAKIYAFPAGGRPPPGRQRETAKTTAPTPQRTPAERAPKTIFGSNWYHQAAVEEADAFFKR